MHISEDEFWRMTPRHFFGLLNEYTKQIKRKNREIRNAQKGKPRREIYRVNFIDEIPGFIK
jgi:hypothetical protein